MSLTEKQWTELARDLRRVLSRAAPGWADGDSHDPGITWLEVLSFGLSELPGRIGPFDARTRFLFEQVALRASALAANAGIERGDCGPGLQRVNCMPGMLLGVDDFQAEQDYFRQRMNRLNRLLHGAGVVSGLGLGLVHDDDGGSLVTLAPGLAFDPAGHEIAVDQILRLALPKEGTDLLVLLSYAERGCHSIAVGPRGSGTADANAAQQPTRLVETFSARLALQARADEVVIGRVSLLDSQWQVDATLEGLRVPAPP